MTPAQRKKLVVAHSVRPQAPLHEVETNRALARWLAQWLARWLARWLALMLALMLARWLQ